MSGNQQNRQLTQSQVQQIQQVQGQYQNGQQTYQNGQNQINGIYASALKQKDENNKRDLILIGVGVLVLVVILVVAIICCLRRRNQRGGVPVGGVQQQPYAANQAYANQVPVQMQGANSATYGNQGYDPTQAPAGMQMQQG